MKDTIKILIQSVAESDNEISAIKSEIARLSLELAAITKIQEESKALIFSEMKDAGEKKVSLDNATVSIRASSRVVSVDDVHQLPERYVRTKKEADKRLIAKDLKTGTPITGAKLVDSEPKLTIKFK